MDQDMFDFIGLLDFDAHSNAVDTWFDEDLLMLVSRNCQWIK